METKISETQSLLRSKVKLYFLLTMCFLLLAILTLSFSIHVGSVKIPIAELWQYLLSPDKEGAMRDIVWNIRLPRNVAAALVGSSLAVSGALLQGVMRNPLADPQIIGVSSGAGLGAMLIIILFPEYIHLVPPFAFVGATIAVFLVYVLAWRNGLQPTRIILAGVAIAAFFGAGTSTLMTFYNDRVHGAISFMVGGLASKNWPEVELILPYVIVGLVLAMFSARKMNILILGDSTAKSLGQNVELTRILITIIATLLAAAAVSVAGLIGFVGLIVPHISRLLFGNDYRILLPVSAFLGMIILTLADMISRLIFSPFEVPAGVVMGLVGAPFFVYLLRKRDYA
ncbi:iron ABC transporter permease [Pueribacillus theae]|uniref:Iron ABC transporter permease n=1 Tax=Pueribacillus theae TaxID=2171751 RepID=A0A2U1JST4_9BACI|nr:iron ABC transporter permease [Pueribacillus theae]PWA08172.1 iron ABC transporter permease [Pueribacillus theae]